ncbi:hypothetical protein Tco_0429789 [Tanacetum coccineum]
MRLMTWLNDLIPAPRGKKDTSSSSSWRYARDKGDGCVGDGCVGDGCVGDGYVGVWLCWVMVLLVQQWYNHGEVLQIDMFRPLHIVKDFDTKRGYKICS